MVYSTGDQIQRVEVDQQLFRRHWAQFTELAATLGGVAGPADRRLVIAAVITSHKWLGPEWLNAPIVALAELAASGRPVRRPLVYARQRWDDLALRDCGHHAEYFYGRIDIPRRFLVPHEAQEQIDLFQRS